jgi:DNA-nicking Smr family endonuclease
LIRTGIGAFTKGTVVPDISIDLHGQGLAGAHARLDHTLEQAIHQRLRVVLLVTGKARAHDRTSGSGRGALLPSCGTGWRASRHASHIAAVRQAHPRHGGDGALVHCVEALIG